MTAARPATARRAALTAVLLVVIVAVPAALYFWGRSSDSFDVRRVAVTGEERLPQREVQRLLEARFIGENLFTVGEGDVRTTLSRYPYVADVHVDRDFPDTLRIKLTEHEPASLLLSNGTWYVLSREGLALAQLDAIGGAQATEPTSDQSPGAQPGPAPSATPTRIGTIPVPARTIVPRALRGLPLMTTKAGSVAVGEPVDDPLVVAGLDLVTALPARLRRDVTAVKVDETRAQVYLREGPVVEFGAVDDLGVKVLALRAVIDRYRQRRVKPTLIDVSVPSRPLGSPLLPTPGPS